MKYIVFILQVLYLFSFLHCALQYKTLITRRTVSAYKEISYQNAHIIAVFVIPSTYCNVLQNHDYEN